MVATASLGDVGIDFVLMFQVRHALLRELPSSSHSCRRPLPRLPMLAHTFAVSARCPIGPDLAHRARQSKSRPFAVAGPVSCHMKTREAHSLRTCRGRTGHEHGPVKVRAMRRGSNKEPQTLLTGNRDVLDPRLPPTAADMVRSCSPPVESGEFHPIGRSRSMGPSPILQLLRAPLRSRVTA